MGQTLGQRFNRLLETYIETIIAVRQTDIVETLEMNDQEIPDRGISWSYSLEDSPLDYSPKSSSRCKYTQKLKESSEWQDNYDELQSLRNELQDRRDEFLDVFPNQSKKEAIQYIDEVLDTFGRSIEDTVKKRLFIPGNHPDEDGLLKYATLNIPLGNRLIADILDTSGTYVSHVLNDRPGNRPTDAVKAKVRERDGNTCVSCGCTDDLKFHHIIPPSEGGAGDEENIALVCNTCHIDVHGGNWNSTAYDSLEGFWEFVSTPIEYRTLEVYYDEQITAVDKEMPLDTSDVQFYGKPWLLRHLKEAGIITVKDLVTTPEPELKSIDNIPTDAINRWKKGIRLSD